jgi:hypothetical protein
VWVAKPSTVAGYRFLLREPGERHKRGGGVSPGRIMQAFSDRPPAAVRTGEASAFLRELDRAGLTPRNVNKHRSVLASLFNYGCRSDTFDLPANPVDGTDKRHEPPPAVKLRACTCERPLGSLTEAFDEEPRRPAESELGTGIRATAYWSFAPSLEVVVAEAGSSARGWTGAACLAHQA